MKAIIDGKRYDTATATKVAHYWNGASYTDFSCVTEDLYRTTNGAWFVHGEGGALSSYATPLEGGRARGGGSAIRPLSDGEAQEWLEDHDEHEAIEKYFAATIQDA